MKKYHIPLLLLTSSFMIGCSTNNPNINKTSIEDHYVESNKQEAVIYFGNQLSNVAIELTPEVAQNQNLAQRGFSNDYLQNYLKDNLLNSGLFSKNSATGLKLDILITDANIRSSFGAKNFGSLNGSDYINTLVTITDKKGDVLSSAKINTPKLAACPTVEENGKFVPNCSEQDRIMLLNSYLVTEITDFIRGKFKQ